ncbi:MAG: hypothetical protein QXX30_04135 [Candidatus Aenigmatarchaeota archaeon]
MEISYCFAIFSKGSERYGRINISSKESIEKGNGENIKKDNR